MHIETKYCYPRDKTVMSLTQVYRLMYAQNRSSIDVSAVIATRITNVVIPNLASDSSDSFK